MKHFILLFFTLILIAGCSSSGKTGFPPKTSSQRTNTTPSVKSNTTTSKSTQPVLKKPGELPSNSMSTSEAERKLGLKISQSDNQKLYFTASSWIGVKHKLGGNTRQGIDCSGFTKMIYQEVYGKNISRTSADILNVNCKVITKGKLQEGDLVFFRTDGKKSNVPNHVGVYLKQNKFVHASTSKGVVVSDLTQQYYIDTFIAAGRVK